MASRDEGQNVERVFTLAEANQLIPELEDHLGSVKRAKAVLIRIKEEVKKAAAQARAGGGTYAGRHYITSLEHISEHLRAVQEMGVLVKDLDLGLCDFPFQMDGRIVYLCWKCGESEIHWWHEIDTGFASRQPLQHVD
jgi:hypothetical protein